MFTSRKIYVTLLLGIILSACMQKKPANKELTNSEVVQQNINKIVKQIKEPNIVQTFYNVMDYTSESANIYENIKPVLDSVIDLCHNNEGGIVVIPAGAYFCKGPIHLKSNVNLHLEEGANITFSQNPKDYLPAVFVRWEGVECYNYSPFVYAKDQQNIAVTGKGTFNGNAEGGMFLWRSEKKEKPDIELLRSMGHDGVAVEERVFGEEHYLRPAFMQFVNCQQLLIEDITITNVPFWAIQPTYCKSVTVRGIKVNSMNMTNDGCDPDSSEDVLIENCWFRTGDDAVAIKSGRDQDGWRINKPSKNIVIRNNYAEKVWHGVACGSEMSGGAENIFIQNLELKKVQRYAIQFKSNKDRGGYVKNVFIDNLKVDSTMTLLYFTTDYHSYRGGNSPSLFEKINISNVTCNHVEKYALDIVGLPEQYIQQIKLENVEIKSAEQGNRIKNVDELTFDEVVMNGDQVNSI